MILNYLFQGFLLGIAYVAPIGMQNLYVINTAVSKNKARAYQVALIIIFFDISLAIACFFGMGLIMDKFEILKAMILFIGSIAVMYIGYSLIRSKPELKSDIDVNKTIMQVIAICFTVTWLNPQALIDGSLLLGGFRASLPIADANVFIAGVAIASFTWFMGITTIIISFRNVFNVKVLTVINYICGGVIIVYGVKLAYTFYQIII
ncbi:MAG: LysE family transporter [Bacillota bacterium]|nr:LysE family transporter [Bacillota bacterium]